VTGTSARTGPRPLALHLTAAGAISASSLSAWPLLRNGWTPWSQSLDADGKALQKDLAETDPEAFAAAVARELAFRHDAFLSGVEKYRAHGYRRRVNDPPPLWESGPVRLRDYGVTAPAAENAIAELISRLLLPGPKVIASIPLSWLFVRVVRLKL